MHKAMSHKISAGHRRRRACLYIRQSSQQQVLNNTESAHRQYGLRRHAVALGWPDDCIDTIDEDQGKSGAHSANRSGFRDLLARVAAREVGIVLSLEVSRLCRNSSDWHQLLQFAAITDTLILDEFGVYNPNNSNDRLLLGVKGALSEYELQGIRDRLVGGQRSKARRGELKLSLPLGFAYTATDEAVKDSDPSIVEAIALVLATLRRLGSVMKTLRWFQKQGVRLPSQQYTTCREVHWAVPKHSKIHSIIRNPRYAGCYAYGRTVSQKRLDGSVQTVAVAIDQWMVCIPEAHVGYIDWPEYLRNQETLRNNRSSFNLGQSPPREGRALLQSRVLCGKCGNRMRVEYSSRSRQTKWYYKCTEDLVRHGKKICQSMRGEVADAAVSSFIIDAVSRENIALTLAVQQQLRADFDAVDRQFLQRIEALRYQADLARTRYMEVDPKNRLVAASLEADWNTCLTTLDDAIAERESRCREHQSITDSKQEERILELARDFQSVWEAPSTGIVDRKRLLRLLIEDVTLTREGYKLQIGLRLRGGKIHILPPADLPRRRADAVRRDASKEALADLEALLEEGLSDKVAAAELNRRGYRDSRGDPFTKKSVLSIRLRLNKASCIHRQRAKVRKEGYVSAAELAATLATSESAIRARALKGKIEARRFAVGHRSYTMYKTTPPAGE